MQKELPAGDTWYKQRRVVEGANNAVFTSAQRMMEEPERARGQADLNFALMGANIRMSREITSLALSLENDLLANNLPLQNFSLEIAKTFEEVIQHVEESNEGLQIPNFQRLKEILFTPSLSGNQQLDFIKSELEKIVFELEAIYLLALRNKG
jgi:uncharacterized membrane protein YccC